MIRWGIWGTGALAHDVAGDFRHAAGTASLRAAASRTEERARRFAARHGAARSYGSLEALLNDAEVDAVYIATPNRKHMEDALACVAAGKAVLCEKPFALDLPQAQRMVNAARGGKVFCMEAMWTRFIPAVAEAKRALAAGELGAVRLMQGSFAYPISADPAARVLRPEEGGGALLDRGVYLVSLAQHLLGSPLSMRASANIGPTGVDEQSAYQLVYDGAIADFSASLRTRGANEVSIGCERGALRLCEPFYRAHRLATQPFSAPAAPSVGDEGGGMKAALRNSSLLRRLSPILAALRGGRVQSFPFAGNGYQFEIQHASGCIREQRLESPIMPLNDSLEVMRILDALRAQMTTARTSS